ncbi:hypothetical protein C1H46_025276 [Malus baccata]|uniref:RNase H type-1 domain-containing protein n=1 Tax=Malus baccata TaxID=106549 RepID=A0A540LRM5_MALBA|nr:hypothetical protein C1H46_025276 [Malus baccata]
MGVGSVIQAELWAVLAGVRLAQQLGVHRLVVESDSSQAVTLIGYHSGSLSAMGLLAEDVTYRLLHTTEFLHTPRTCNGVAHRLARFALSIGNELVWIEEPPNFIQDLLD